ncbi:hypothetical protein FOE78_21350 [Microlunatus elymi]|uniref:Uncharacterized protein n=1 Tax=Microlunatus elymi TaxID=2596828 RepID=A0A516Q3V3_9ACTN|nr:hypothetical protein [Microlunatus elymi]QDP98107.1 hypothetical protein FOE78_21350 [Microlunatus elymi]
MIRPLRTAALVMGAAVALAGCSSASTPSQSPTPNAPAQSGPVRTAPGSATTPSAATPSAATPSAAASGEVRVGDVDLPNFSYLGGCGWEVPAATLEVKNDKQSNRTPSFDGEHSTATLTGHREITLAGRQYALAEFSCTVGQDKIAAVHLVGVVDGKPADLGIVATGSKISTSADHDQLSFRTHYRTIKDGAGASSGKASYKITMIGNTPVRLFAGENPSKINSAVAQLPAHGYDAGLVGVSGYVDDPSETSWVVGLLDKPQRVLTAESLGGGYESGICWKPTVHTQDGEKLGGARLAFNGEDNQTGTAIDLAESSKATVGVRGKINFPIRRDTAGLLIPANGVVPALATATTATATNGQGDALVTTKAPADAYLDVARFGAASGSEYPLPIGAFATADGKITMTGAWYNAPVNQSNAASGMRPIVNPADLGEQTCG